MNLRSVNVFKPIGRRYHPAEHAWSVTVASLQPMMRRAKVAGLFFRNKYTSQILTPKALDSAMRKRQLVQGPPHWLLVDAQNRVVEVGL